MDKENIKELYWLCEELKSYTDLTGERFDTEAAQRRLWPMQPILKKQQLPEIQQLYDSLIDALEVPSFFDKASFSQNVDKLYKLLENLDLRKTD